MYPAVRKRRDPFFSLSHPKLPPIYTRLTEVTGGSRIVTLNIIIQKSFSLKFFISFLSEAGNEYRANK